MIKDYFDLVKDIMIQHKDTRDDDFKLYAWACYEVTQSEATKTIAPKKLSKETPFIDALYHHKEYGLPSYESISRARRKVQEQIPDLAGNRKAKQEKEKEWRNFYHKSRGGHRT